MILGSITGDRLEHRALLPSQVEWYVSIQSFAELLKTVQNWQALCQDNVSTCICPGAPECRTYSHGPAHLALPRPRPRT